MMARLGLKTAVCDHIHSGNVYSLRQTAGIGEHSFWRVSEQLNNFASVPGTLLAVDMTNVVFGQMKGDPAWVLRRKLLR